MKWFSRLAGQGDRRRTERSIGRPLVLTIEGHRYRTRDWSLGGFRLARCDLPLGVGEVVGGVVGRIDGARPGPFRAEVVRIAEDGEIGFRLLEIAPHSFAAMARAGF